MDNYTCVKNDSIIYIIVLIGFLLYLAITKAYKMGQETKIPIQNQTQTQTQTQTKTQTDYPEIYYEPSYGYEKRYYEYQHQDLDKSKNASDVLPEYMLVGYLQNVKKNKLKNMFKLYGKRDTRDRFLYYATSEINDIKVQVIQKNNFELNNGDIVNLNGFNDDYVVTLYY